MLITCQECGLQVSDKAYSCPHCGNPQKQFPKIPPGKISRKRLRLPNGFGRITKIKGRVRKPYRAMVTVGKDENGRPIGKLLKPQAYFDTYNDAYMALVEYNKSPYELASDLTFKEVYDKWIARHSKNITSATLVNVESAYHYCHLIYDTPFREIRIKHIKFCMEEGYVIRRGKKQSPTENTKRNIKKLFNQLFDYAIEFEITDRNYAREYKLKGEVKTQKPHITYTDDEMRILWENQHEPLARITLLQCYSGLRPREVITMKSSNVFLEDGYMVGGMKTEAGRDRIIPIHPLVKNIIEVFLASGHELLVTNEGKPYAYNTLRAKYETFTKAYGISPDHRLHDARKHFVSLAKKYGVDDFAIKRIVGHSVKADITESVYTERPTSWLIKEMSKIKQY